MFVAAKYRDRDYALATTDAGMLPFVSGWRTLDTYGLNDPYIGRYGLNRLHWDSYNPAVVLNHTYNYRYPAMSPQGNRKRMYELMEEQGNYVPVAAIRKQRWLNRKSLSLHVYFLRRDIPDYENLRQDILALTGEEYAVIPGSFRSFFAGQ